MSGCGSGARCSSSTPPPGSTPPTSPRPRSTWSRSPTPTPQNAKAEKDLERQDRAAHHHRFLAISQDGAGGIRLRGRGTVEDAALIKAALLPLTKPAPAVDPQHPDREETVDPRDHGARLWDALVATCTHAMTTDLPPDCHGARPRVTVTTSLEVLQDKIDWATLGTATTGNSSGPDPTRTGGITEDGLELTTAVSAGSPATPRSSRSSSAPAAKSSTSAGPTGS